MKLLDFRNGDGFVVTTALLSDGAVREVLRLDRRLQTSPSKSRPEACRKVVRALERFSHFDDFNGPPLKVSKWAFLSAIKDNLKKEETR